ncbi:spore germination protein [Paenibacillus chungangensis]|uniref:Spore germination protein n=1 Tax=Paenibacillus chungangensis TaxID=696535 RepID=A0ABW3HM17_9BACL
MNKNQQEEMLYAGMESLLQEGELTLAALKRQLDLYADVHFPPLPQLEKANKLTALYCQGMTDKVQLNEYFVRICQFVLHAEAHRDSQNTTDEHHELPLIEQVSSFNGMMKELFSGSFVLYMEGSRYFWSVDVSKVPQRALEESNTEISIKGPKDAFTEDIYTNISLIRKRLHTGLLFCEEFVLGSLSKTSVALMYLQDRIKPEIVTEVRKRIEKIETESLLSSGQLEQWLADRTFSLVPLIDYIGRPDFIVQTLLRGRFAAIVDGSPMVLIGPSNFTELLKSPEDAHFPYYFVMIQRVLRLFGLILSILLPGFWIAIATVNLDQLPFSLVSTVVISREGVPLPTFLEAFLLLFLFELLREAGIRLPKAVGQTIGIVGGLIIGDSLIRAGLASPTLLVVIAVSAVATFALVNQSLSGSVSLLRVLIMVVSAYLGIYGFILAMFSILIYLCRLVSYGFPYLEPIVSLRFREWLSAFLVNPFKRKRFAADMLKKKE